MGSSDNRRHIQGECKPILRLGCHSGDSERDEQSRRFGNQQDFMMLELPTLSLVIIVQDATHRVGSVIAEASRALRHATSLEFIVIDAASGESDDGDDRDNLTQLADTDSRIRLYRQTAAIGADAALWQAGSLARGEWIVTLDARGRDDPHDIPDMLCEARHQGLTLVEGIPLDPRCRWRKPLFRAARSVGIELADSERCGLRLIQRDVLTALPSVESLHRFLPLLIRRSGGRIGSYRVNRRQVTSTPRPSHWSIPARIAGHARDWLGMWWLSRRWHAQRPPSKRRVRVYAR
jgi:dolichol-phosphate mannosyltransferase